MYGMLGVMAELQRALILANTRDGLAAARARGRVGGRKRKLTPLMPSRRGGSWLVGGAVTAARRQIWSQHPQRRSSSGTS
jgi:hypothetical protein